MVYLGKGFPGGTSGKEPSCQYRRCKRCRFDPWVGKIPWRTKWQLIPVFLPGKSYGQRNLAGCKESDTPEGLSRAQHPGAWGEIRIYSVNELTKVTAFDLGAGYSQR